MKGTKSATLETSGKWLDDNTYLIDSPGFADPKRTAAYLWEHLVKNLLEEQQIDNDEGIPTIVFTSMINKGGRISNETVETIFELLLMLTVFYPDFDPAT